MPGRNNSLWLALLFALLAGALDAQLLPEIGEVEVQGANLTLLDNDGRRRGTLKGKRAVRARDKRVDITGGELTLLHGDAEMVLTFTRASYTPGSREIDLPEGLKGTLPDGGALEFAKGKVAMDEDQPLAITATTDGPTSLRIGPETASDFDASLRSAALSLAFSRAKQLELAAISGAQGANFSLRLDRVPSWTASPQAAPGRLAATCGGGVKLDYSQTRAVFALEMDRRCRAEITGATRSELNADSMKIEGATIGGDAAVSAVSARGNVEIKAVGLDVIAGEADFREGETRTLRLARDPRVVFTRLDGTIECRASQRIEAESDTLGDAERQRIELQGAARLLGNHSVFSEGRVRTRQWVIEGSQCAVTRIKAQAERYEFSGKRQGFSPLLTFSADGFKAVLRGESASGGIADGRLSADIAGPHINALIEGIPALVPTLRAGLALSGPEAAQDKSPVRLVMQAADAMRVECGFNEHEPVRVEARGAVLIDQAPENLAGRLSASAQECVLSVGGEDANRRRPLEELRLAPKPGEKALLSLGADLLMCARLSLALAGADYTADIMGPGRLVFRDADSLGYMREAVAELPEVLSRLEPDAGWLNFSVEANLRTRMDERLIVARDALFRLVRGDFVAPRSGLDAFKDLAELEAADVRTLYEARGASMTATLELQHRRHAGSSSITLEGPAEIRSTLDGMSARAADGISIRRIHRVNRASDTVEVSLNRDAAVDIVRAAAFLSDEGGGMFPFTGPWKATARKLIRLRFRPAPAAVARVSRGIAGLIVAQAPEDKLERTIAALRVELAIALRRLSPEQREDFQPQAEEARRALARAAMLARAAAILRRVNDTRGATDARALAVAALRGAQGPLGPQVDLEAEGDVFAHFEQAPRKLERVASDAIGDLMRGREPGRETAAVPGGVMEMTLERVELSLDGVGNIRALQATGPITLARANYRLEGARFQRSASGALILEEAKLILAPDSGIKVHGLRRLEVQPELRPRVRAVGKKLKLELTVSRAEGNGDGE